MKHPSAETEIHIPFYDLDPMQIVWHGNYFKYFELARCAVLDRIRYGYSEMLDSGYTWPLIEANARFVRPARLGQRVVCRAEIVEYENRLKICYEIRCRTTNERLTKGYSVQVAVNARTGEMMLASPQVMLDRVRIFHEENAGN